LKNKDSEVLIHFQEPILILKINKENNYLYSVDKDNNIYECNLKGTI